jgi:hypothetical protein
MYGCMMVYDRANQASLLHGGHWSSRTQSGIHGYISSIWVYDLDEDSWTEMQTAFNPLGRYWHTMAYDSSRGESLIYGGSDGSDDPKSDAWTYDYATNTWAPAQGKTLGSPTTRLTTHTSCSAASVREHRYRASRGTPGC